MSLTYWNRRRREAALEGELRDPEEVLDAAEATAGDGGTEGVEGHTGTTLTVPPLGAADSSGIDTHGETHEDAALEAEGDPQGPEAQDAAQAPDGAPEGDDTPEGENGAEGEAQGSPEGQESAPEGDAPKPEKPKGNASADEWRAYALNPDGGAKTEADLEGLNRDGIRDLFAD